MPQRFRRPFHPLLWALCLGLTGCPVRVDFGKDGEPKDVGELLRRVAFAEEQVMSIKGEAKLKIDGSKGKGSITLFAAVMHPAFLHIESLDFFGRPVGSLVSDGARFGLYDGQAGRYYQGPASAENVGRFVPIALPPSELAALLLGRAPRLPEAKAEMTFDPKAGQFIVTLRREQVTQRVWVQPPTYRVVRSRVEGLKTYDLDFEDIEVVGAVSYPRKVVLEARGEKLELNYKDIVINETLETSMFEIAPPANVPVVEVDAQGNPKGN